MLKSHLINTTYTEMKHWLRIGSIQIGTHIMGYWKSISWKEFRNGDPQATAISQESLNKARWEGYMGLRRGDGSDHAYSTYSFSTEPTSVASHTSLTVREM
jgi:hypothetical protein